MAIGRIIPKKQYIKVTPDIIHSRKEIRELLYIGYTPFDNFIEYIYDKIVVRKTVGYIISTDTGYGFAYYVPDSYTEFNIKNLGHL